jgi:predicted metal-binding protein
MRLLRTLQTHAAGYRAISTGEIRFDPAFRAACEANACGFFGVCWMCPPDVGDVADLIARAKAFEHALVFQTVCDIADSFDIEGMRRAARQHNRLIVRLRRAVAREGKDCLALGAGACGGCSTCSKKKGEPCRHPERAVIPLEAAGIDVIALSRSANLPYLNGKNTVTYFGALLSHEPLI